MKALLILLLVIMTNRTWSADLKYPVSAIPEELKENVNVVVREDHMVYIIYSKHRALSRIQFVVTILNDKGNDYARKTVYYNNLSKVTDMNAVVYDATGKQIKKLRNNEIYEQSAYDGSLYSDLRLKHVDLSQANYPYTVAFDYEIEYKYLYSIPSSYLISEKQSLQSATYQLIFPPALKPRYYTRNLNDVKPAMGKSSDGMESITWTFQNLKPIKHEVNGPRISELVPEIMAAPSDFEYDGYPGKMSTWTDYGKWLALLNKDRDALPEPTRNKVRLMTADLKTVEEKVKVLYEYMQSRSRYVSIQYGIGGLQPFPASVVDEKGYGDCKALSNYMVALLKEAGIKGYYATISAGYDQPEIIVDFPSHQGNHVIVAVPNAKDTLWMECTSQTMPFGYLGSFTADRYALFVTEEGGKLVRTPNYTADQNKLTRTAKVIVDLAGNAKADVSTRYSGMQYDAVEDIINDGPDDQKKWIESNTDIPSFSITSYSVKGYRDKIPSVQLNLSLTMNRYASVSGKRLFVVPNLMNRVSVTLQKEENRKTEVVRKSNYLAMDTVILQIPESLYPEFLPAASKFTSRFGEYESNYQFKDGIVVYTRRLKAWKGKFPKETYNELVEFLKNVSKADNTKLVFLSKT